MATHVLRRAKGIHGKTLALLRDGRGGETIPKPRPSVLLRRPKHVILRVAPTPLPWLKDRA